MRFIGLPDGRYLAQAPDLNAEFFAGAYVRFTSRGADYGLQLEGARETAVPVGLVPSPTRVSIMQGDEPANWRAGLPTFGALRYEAVYPGIDMLYGAAGRLKSEFLVSPGADPSRIRMRFSGGTLAVSKQGSLIVRTAGGELRDEHLEVFQTRAGRRVPVAARFRLLRPDVASFELGAYDRTLPLTIDPVITYSSYQGGTRIDQITSVATDATGAAYVAGWTDSSNFPTLAALRGFSGSVEAFVAKISPTGTPVWVTYLGGSGDDRALGIDADPLGNVYVTGFTTSANFPKVAPLQANKNLGRDAFVAKINPSGTALVFSTYWGGSGADMANSISVDIYGQSHVVGETDSSDFPTAFPYQSALGGSRDAFLFKIGVSGNVSYSTYIGGNGDDRGMGVVISLNLKPVVVGCTTSTNLPTVNATRAANQGGQDGFVVRFDGDAAFPIYFTYLGGSRGGPGQPECAYSVATDAFFNAYIAGVTGSTNFPIRNAVQPTFGGGTLDGFFAKLDSGGFLLNSTYIGGTGSDVATGIKVDSARRAYVAGYTSSANLPLFGAMQTTIGGSYDAFLMRYDVPGFPLTYGSYLGGTGSDLAFGLAVTPGGFTLIGGVTSSPNFPRQSPFQTNYAGSTDGFITSVTGY